MANKTLAFEIGTEELPAFDLHDATTKLGGIAAKALDGAKIPHGAIDVYTTPRRLIVIVADVPERTEASVEEFRGPSAKIAFDENGQPTKAAIGFAKGKGVDPSTLERRDENGVEYVYAIKETPSIDVASLLPDLLGSIITGIEWPKSQRWGSRREQFSRPVRWLLAMLGETVVPVEFAGLTADSKTFGHRFLSPGPHDVSSADALIDVLRANFVVPSEAEREASIREQVKAIEAETGLVSELPAKTMEEVVNLTEYPTVMVGEFDELFLAVPKEITVDAMLVHQRYFPLFNADGSLSNKFLITSNGNPKYHDNIVDGNQRVVAARLYDAKFFYDEDLKQPLEAYVEKLGEGYKRPGKNYIDQSVANGLLARYYLLTQKWSEAASAAKAARAGYTQRNNASLHDGFMDVDASDVMWGFNHTSETQTAYASYFSHISNLAPGYAGLNYCAKLIDKRLYDQIADDDYRKTLFNGPAGDASQPTAGAKLPYANLKFGSDGNWTMDYIYMRAAEMVLIEAEALARQGKNAEAATVLKELMSNRQPSWNKTSVTVEDVLLQRRIELWGEGFSYFDLKRNNKGIDRNYEGSNHLAGYLHTIPAFDVRWTYQIPQSEMQENSHIQDSEQNP